MTAAAKNNSFVVRTLCGAGVAAAVVGAALAGPWAFGALLMLVMVFAVLEFGQLALRMKMPLPFSVPLRLVWIVLPLLLLMWLYIHVGRWTVLWYVFIVWANDVGAYLVGVTLGRRRGLDCKLCPRISPLKTWTGFCGGLFFGIATGIVAAKVMGWDVAFWAGLAAVAVVTGVAGDLAESMFKRAAGVKDSGNILPGHGGMLDRFDALIFSAPFVFVYILVFA